MCGYFGHLVVAPVTEMTPPWRSPHVGKSAGADQVADVLDDDEAVRSGFELDQSRCTIIASRWQPGPGVDLDGAGAAARIPVGRMPSPGRPRRHLTGARARDRAFAASVFPTRASSSVDRDDPRSASQRRLSAQSSVVAGKDRCFQVDGCGCALVVGHDRAMTVAMTVAVPWPCPGRAHGASRVGVYVARPTTPPGSRSAPRRCRSRRFRAHWPRPPPPIRARARVGDDLDIAAAALTEQEQVIRVHSSPQVRSAASPSGSSISRTAPSSGRRPATASSKQNSNESRTTPARRADLEDAPGHLRVAVRMRELHQPRLGDGSSCMRLLLGLRVSARRPIIRSMRRRR